MTVDIAAILPPPVGPATPEAIAALRAQPGFAGAMRTSAAGIVALYEGRHLLNWLMDDRARLLFGYFALYLHFTRDPDDPASGLTPTRMKALCAEVDICSPGRVSAMLALMRLGGHVAPDEQGPDRRQRRLVATSRLTELLAARWRLHFAAMAPLMEDGAALLAALDDQRSRRFLVIAMTERFRAGFRFLTDASGLGLFSERSGGILILTSLMTAGEDDDTIPPSSPVPVSISALARRFAVSRPHVRKLIRDAARDGVIELTEPDGSRVLIGPQLAEAARNFIATMYLYFADCARAALAATRSCPDDGAIPPGSGGPVPLHHGNPEQAGHGRLFR